MNCTYPHLQVMQTRCYTEGLYQRTEIGPSGRPGQCIFILGDIGVRLDIAIHKGLVEVNSDYILYIYILKT